MVADDPCTSDYMYYYSTTLVPSQADRVEKMSSDATAVSLSVWVEQSKVICCEATGVTAHASRIHSHSR